MNSLLICATVGYCFMILWMLKQWRRAAMHEVPAAFLPSKKLTVLIPFRNEASALAQLLPDLRKQNFPSELSEFIFINDHSTDSGPEMVGHFCAETPGARMLHLSENSGKKAAVSLGISESSGGLAVTLDADMRVHPEWLRTIAHFWETTRKRFIIMPIAIDSRRGFLNLFQVIETDSLIGSTGAFALANRPIMCNGGNLAFETSLFQALGGYEDNKHISSGDDIFLLQKCRKMMPTDIGWLHHPLATATTAPCPSIGAFLNQRIRWSAKTKHYSDLLPKGVAIVVAVANMALIIALAAIPFEWVSVPVLAIAYISKILVDGIFLWQVARFFSHRKLFWAYPAVALLYPVYIFVTVLAGMVYRPRWKGRKTMG